MGEVLRLSAIARVLHVAARHASILEQGAFAELASTIGEFVPFDRLSILVPEGRLALRVHALSQPGAPAITFGSTLPGDDEVWRALFERQEPHFCDDMERGDAVEQMAARAGLRSYGAFPVRAEDAEGREAPRVVAVMVLVMSAPGAGRGVDVSLAQAIADALGPSVERSLRLARERRLAMILETSADAMLAWDRDGRVTDVNDAAATLAGRARSELIGLPITDLLDLPAISGDPPLADADPVTLGHRLSLRASGPDGPRRIPVAATVTVVPGDALVAAHALLRDLSQVVRAEEEAAARLSRIHELTEQHRTLLDNAPLIIFRLDPASGELVYLNRHAERLLGVPTEEALGTPGFLRAAHADAEGVAAFDAAVGRAQSGALSLPYEAHLSCRHGEEISARGTVYPLLAEDGRVAAIEGVLADVSAEQAARKRLVQADRLSTLGTLAAGVAHEINNPAAFILLGLDMLGRMLSGSGVRMDPAIAEGAGETLRELRDSIRRIVDIARDLRLFASAPAHEGSGAGRTIVDVNRTVESALSLTRGRILERAQIERQLGDVPPVVMEDGRLGQVVANLLVNAVQAIPRSYAGDQRITVATRSDGWTVQIEVSDTGVGIAPEHLPRIWQPFFTTRGAEVGTGLGLSIGREIIERAGGTITAESPLPGADPPRGARFTITLPAAGQSAPVSPRPGSLPAPGEARPRARVLIVEDEAPLARALAEEIGRHHEVTLADNGERAQARLAEGRFDVVLCDLRMPVMSGEGLYSRVAERDEEQARAFIFMTGVGFGAEVERFLAASGRPMLEKPFSADVALTAIARVIKQRSRG